MVRILRMDRSKRVNEMLVFAPVLVYADGHVVKLLAYYMQIIVKTFVII